MIDLAIAHFHVLLLRLGVADVGVAEGGGAERSENVIELRTRRLHAGGGL
jgi:hypothetical protein